MRRRSPFSLAGFSFKGIFPGAALALMACILSGCLVGPKPERPALPDKTGYSNTPITRSSGRDQADNALRTSQLIYGLDIPGKWWEIFQNPRLNQLVDQALANNHDLRAMQAGLRAAWEQRRVEGAALYPSISAQFIPSRNKTSHDLSPVPNNNTWLYNLHTAQLNIGYVPDFWGGERQAIRAAAAQANIQRFQLEATALTLISNLVNAAITEAGLRAQIRGTQVLIEQQKELLQITEQQERAGDVSLAARLQQRNILAQLEADLPPLQTQLEQTRDQIASLSGQTANATLPVFELQDFTFPQTMPVSLPSALLQQRPDIQAAYAQIQSGAALVGVAIANRLPNVQLSALPGQAVGEMSQMFRHGYGNWTLAATVTQPIFQGGSLLHAQREAEQNLHQAQEMYQSTVISAVNDVADSLHALDYDGKTLLADQNGLEAAQKALEIAEKQKRFGDISQRDLIAARVFVTQDELSVAQDIMVRFSDSTGLFQALGGGWWHRNDLGLPKAEAKRLSTTLVPW